MYLQHRPYLRQVQHDVLGDTHVIRKCASTVLCFTRASESLIVLGVGASHLIVVLPPREISHFRLRDLDDAVSVTLLKDGTYEVRMLDHVQFPRS